MLVSSARTDAHGGGSLSRRPPAGFPASVARTLDSAFSDMPTAPCLLVALALPTVGGGPAPPPLKLLPSPTPPLPPPAAFAAGPNSGALSSNNLVSNDDCAPDDAFSYGSNRGRASRSNSAADGGASVSDARVLDHAHPRYPAAAQYADTSAGERVPVALNCMRILGREEGGQHHAHSPSANDNKKGLAHERETRAHERETRMHTHRHERTSSTERRIRRQGWTRSSRPTLPPPHPPPLHPLRVRINHSERRRRTRPHFARKSPRKRH